MRAGEPRQATTKHAFTDMRQDHHTRVQAALAPLKTRARHVCVLHSSAPARFATFTRRDQSSSSSSSSSFTGEHVICLKITCRHALGRASLPAVAHHAELWSQGRQAVFVVVAADDLARSPQQGREGDTTQMRRSSSSRTGTKFRCLGTTPPPPGRDGTSAVGMTSHAVSRSADQQTKFPTLALAKSAPEEGEKGEGGGRGGETGCRTSNSTESSQEGLLEFGLTLVEKGPCPPRRSSQNGLILVKKESR